MRFLIFFLLLTLSALADKEPLPFTPVWVDAQAHLSGQALDEALKDIKRQQAEPRHIVVLIHGYATAREDSERQYSLIAGRIREAFARRQQQVVVVGVQWDSAVTATSQLLASTYLEMVPRARSVGRDATRQLLLALQEHYPRASLSIYAHSMGCEVSAAALAPNLPYAEYQPTRPAWSPETRLHLSLLTLAGSDLDYDLGYKYRDSLSLEKDDCKLIWMTVSSYLDTENRDRALMVRHFARGRAGGTALPRLSQNQYNHLLGNRMLFVEDRDIPEGHDFILYYGEARVDRLAETELYLADPTRPEPADLTELDRVLATPNEVESLRPWLDSEHLAVRMYALWRLEMLVCGGSQHLEDETLEHVTRLLKNKPSLVWRQQKTSPCQSIRRGYWPTEAQMTRAGAPAWAKP